MGSAVSSVAVWMGVMLRGTPASPGELVAPLVLSGDDRGHGHLLFELLFREGLLADAAFPRTLDEYREACQAILQWLPGLDEP